MNRSASRPKMRYTAMNTNTYPKLLQISECLYPKFDSTYSFTVVWPMELGAFVNSWQANRPLPPSYSPVTLFHVGSSGQSVNTREFINPIAYF
ncbi:hypothetical protein DVH05_028510 [Phytophthora capsici]|nr:hypothetical protein DVH05_028510 [Phytophthora capsici]